MSFENYSKKAQDVPTAKDNDSEEYVRDFTAATPPEADEEYVRNFTSKPLQEDKNEEYVRNFTSKPLQEDKNEEYVRNFTSEPLEKEEYVRSFVASSTPTASDVYTSNFERRNFTDFDAEDASSESEKLNTGYKEYDENADSFHLKDAFGNIVAALVFCYFFKTSALDIGSITAMFSGYLVLFAFRLQDRLVPRMIGALVWLLLIGLLVTALDKNGLSLPKIDILEYLNNMSSS